MPERSPSSAPSLTSNHHPGGSSPPATPFRSPVPSARPLVAEVTAVASVWRLARRAAAADGPWRLTTRGDVAVDADLARRAEGRPTRTARRACGPTGKAAAAVVAALARRAGEPSTCRSLDRRWREVALWRTRCTTQALKKHFPIRGRGLPAFRSVGHECRNQTEERDTEESGKLARSGHEILLSSSPV